MGKLFRDRADEFESSWPCHRWLQIGVLLVLSAAASETATLDSQAAALPKELAPAKGTFLVASPRMSDPRFSYSVILLLEHGEDGTLGLIINKDTEIPLSRVLPDLDVGGSDDHKLYLGGPVGRDLLIYLARSEEPPERSSHLMGDVYFGGGQGRSGATPQREEGRQRTTAFFWSFRMGTGPVGIRTSPQRLEGASRRCLHCVR